MSSAVFTREAADVAGARSAPATPRLPCLPSEQLNQLPFNRGGQTQRQTARRVEIEIWALANRYGFERLGFLTLTFADDVKTIKEASRRFNSLNTHVLRRRYVAWIAVIHRHKDGTIHFHLVVVCPVEIRRGFDFEGVRRRDYSSASVWLKGEWSFWRSITNYDGNHPDAAYPFGRAELLPVRKGVAEFAGYVARYLIKQYGTRQDEKGARLVRYSQGWRTVHGPFSWLGDRNKKLRAIGRLRWIGEQLGFKGEAGAEKEFGPRWRWYLGRTLYCSDVSFVAVVLEAKESLEFYNGIPFALKEAWEQFDVQAAEFDRRSANGGVPSTLGW